MIISRGQESVTVRSRPGSLLIFPEAGMEEGQSTRMEGHEQRPNMRRCREAARRKRRSSASLLSHVSPTCPCQSIPAAPCHPPQLQAHLLGAEWWLSAPWISMLFSGHQMCPAYRYFSFSSRKVEGMGPRVRPSRSESPPPRRLAV